MSEEPRLVKHKQIRDALRYVADNPLPKVEPVDMPVWELVSRILFEHANTPDAKVRGSFSRATRAQKMITDRLVGTRRPGSRPVAGDSRQVVFRDLTGGQISE